MQNNDFHQQLAYDLRQGYARIVNEHMVDIYMARKESEYPEYFKALENLYTIVAHKISKPEKEALKNKKSFQTYEILSKRLKELAGKYPSVYSGQAKSREVTYFEVALRDMEKHLYAMMDKAKMFGSSRVVEGLS